MDAVLAETKRLLGQGALGEIVRTQTTFLDLQIKAGGSVTNTRIHYDNKQEFAVCIGPVRSLTVETHHPLLIDYKQDWYEVFFVGRPHDPEDLLSQLRDITTRQSAGWRSFEHYANAAIERTRLLESGYGMLMSGPEQLVCAIIPVLEAAGVKAKSIECRFNPRAVGVLLLDNRYVIAQGFSGERIK